MYDGGAIGDETAESGVGLDAEQHEQRKLEHFAFTSGRAGASGQDCFAKSCGPPSFESPIRKLTIIITEARSICA